MSNVTDLYLSVFIGHATNAEGEPKGISTDRYNTQQEMTSTRDISHTERHDYRVKKNKQN